LFIYFYQLDFIKPGISPFKALFLKTNLETENLLKTPLDLPETKHLLLILFTKEFLGSK